MPLRTIGSPATTKIDPPRSTCDGLVELASMILKGSRHRVVRHDTKTHLVCDQHDRPGSVRERAEQRLPGGVDAKPMVHEVAELHGQTIDQQTYLRPTLPPDRLR